MLLTKKLLKFAYIQYTIKSGFGNDLVQLIFK